MMRHEHNQDLAELIGLLAATGKIGFALWRWEPKVLGRIVAVALLEADAA